MCMLYCITSNFVYFIYIYVIARLKYNVIKTNRLKCSSVYVPTVYTLYTYKRLFARSLQTEMFSFEIEKSAFNLSIYRER